MNLSVVTPVRNEQECIRAVVENLCRALELRGIDYEIILVNDNSTDDTSLVLGQMSGVNKRIKIFNSPSPHGFGIAIRKGLENVAGEVVVIFMGDGSDDAQDVVKYYDKIQEGFDCVFGSRFMKGSKVTGYSGVKLILNRLGNKFIQLLFLIRYNDTSNAFKAYRIKAIKAIQPLVSQYFNITVEIALKAIIRGFSYAVIPIKWDGRKSGVSKYKIRDLLRKYFFSIFFVWLEKILLKEEIQKNIKQAI